MSTSSTTCIVPDQISPSGGGEPKTPSRYSSTASANDAGESVAAARYAKPWSAAAEGPGAAVGRHDVALHALHQHDRLIDFGRLQSATDRVVVDLLFVAIEQRGQLSGMRQEDRMPAFSKLRLAPLEAVQKRRVEHDTRRTPE